MTTYEIHRKQWVPQPLEKIFEFFAKAENLEELTPPFLHFQITLAPPRMEAGARIEYKLRVHGLPIHWRTIIEEWDPPKQFRSPGERSARAVAPHSSFLDGERWHVDRRHGPLCTSLWTDRQDREPRHGLAGCECNLRLPRAESSRIVRVASKPNHGDTAVLAPEIRVLLQYGITLDARPGIAVAGRPILAEDDSGNLATLLHLLQRTPDSESNLAAHTARSVTVNQLHTLVSCTPRCIQLAHHVLPRLLDGRQPSFQIDDLEHAHWPRARSFAISASSIGGVAPALLAPQAPMRFAAAVIVARSDPRR